MKSIAAIAQCRASQEPEKNLCKAEFFCREAREESACFVIFPEYFMTYYPIEGSAYYEKAQTLDGPFVQGMKRLAAAHGQWILFGMSEKPGRDSGGKCFNTAVLLDDRGNLCSVYRKTHLFDAFSWKESDSTLPGEVLHEPVNTPLGKAGLGTCYDLRFPEPARIQALKVQRF